MKKNNMTKIVTVTVPVNVTTAVTVTMTVNVTMGATVTVTVDMRVSHNNIYTHICTYIRTYTQMRQLWNSTLFFPASIPVSQAAKSFITCCLTPDAAKRPSAAQMLDHAWLNSGVNR